MFDFEFSIYIPKFYVVFKIAVDNFSKAQMFMHINNFESNTLRHMERVQSSSFSKSHLTTDLVPSCVYLFFPISSTFVKANYFRSTPR